MGEPDTLVVLEPTGGYELDLVCALGALCIRSDSPGMLRRRRHDMTSSALHSDYTFHGIRARGITPLDDGQRFAVVTRARAAIYDAAKGTRGAPIKIEPLRRHAVSSDGRWLVRLAHSPHSG